MKLWFTCTTEGKYDISKDRLESMVCGACMEMFDGQTAELENGRCMLCWRVFL